MGLAAFNRYRRQQAARNQAEEPSEASLDDLTRAELDALAEEEGVESPSSLANKGEVIAAIREGRGS